MRGDEDDLTFRVGLIYADTGMLVPIIAPFAGDKRDDDRLTIIDAPVPGVNINPDSIARVRKIDPVEITPGLGGRWFLNRLEKWGRRWLGTGSRQERLEGRWRDSGG